MSNEVSSIEKSNVGLASDFRGLIEQVASNPELGQNLQMLLDAQERIIKYHAEKDFNEAMSRLQGKIPQFVKDSQGHNSKYTKMESIDDILRPLLSEEGFSFSFDSDPMPDGKNTLYSAKLRHKSGHFDVKKIPLPLDTGGSKQGPQCSGSTITYAQRYLVKMMLNIVTRGEDFDGISANKTISLDQAVEIDQLLTETKSDKERFLKWVGAESVPDIKVKKYDEALKFLKQKKVKK